MQTHCKHGEPFESWGPVVKCSSPCYRKWSKVDQTCQIQQLWNPLQADFQTVNSTRNSLPSKIKDKGEEGLFNSFHLSGQNEEAMATWSPDTEGQAAVLLWASKCCRGLRWGKIHSLPTAENNSGNVTDQLGFLVGSVLSYCEGINEINTEKIYK